MSVLANLSIWTDAIGNSIEFPVMDSLCLSTPVKQFGNGDDL